MGFLKEFKEFAMRGNVADMAVGVIIGGAFGKVVSSLVGDVLMPPLGLLMGGMDFKQFSFTLKAAAGEEKAVVLNYGVFISTLLDFIIVALAVFLMIKLMNAMKRKRPAPPPSPSEKPCPQCLMAVPLAAKRCGHCTSAL